MARRKIYHGTPSKRLFLTLLMLTSFLKITLFLNSKSVLLGMHLLISKAILNVAKVGFRYVMT